MKEFTINGFAKEVGVAESTIRRHIERGVLKPTRTETITVEVHYLDERALGYFFSSKYQDELRRTQPAAALLLSRTKSGQPARKRKKRDYKLPEIMPRGTFEVPEMSLPFEYRAAPDEEFQEEPLTRDEKLELFYDPETYADEPSSLPPEPITATQVDERVTAIEGTIGDLDYRRLKTLVRAMRGDGLSEDAIMASIQEYERDCHAADDQG